MKNNSASLEKPGLHGFIPSKGNAEICSICGHNFYGEVPAPSSSPLETPSQPVSLPKASTLLRKLNRLLSHTYQLSENEDWDVLHEIRNYLRKQARGATPSPEPRRKK